MFRRHANTVRSFNWCVALCCQVVNAFGLAAGASIGARSMRNRDRYNEQWAAMTYLGKYGAFGLFLGGEVARFEPDLLRVWNCRIAVDCREHRRSPAPSDQPRSIL